MNEISLTPQGHLQWHAFSDDAQEERFAYIGEAFRRDWREGLFQLAAEKIDVGGSPTLRYWQVVAEAFLARLCRMPEGASPSDVEPPSLEERAPRWRQVGRVCFHLAENKADPDRPSAVMATYVSGLGEGYGRQRVEYLPIMKPGQRQ